MHTPVKNDQYERKNNTHINTIKELVSTLPTLLIHTGSHNLICGI